ncbi:LPS export ABC transporter ATP-binding protein [bacterium]|nr:MAG: LPS export ABC transporter ATP-binding protein [bacterium]
MKIRTENLQKSYRGRKVVDGVSFDVNMGEIVGLLGPNGAGKTTSFYMTVGLVRPNAGRVYLEKDGKTHDITRWPMHKRARAGIGYLPQETSVFRKLTVEDNLRLVLELAGQGRKEQKAKVEELAEELQITRVLHSTASVLSGGERRRVEIARAMATEPSFILLDEPFTGIDPVTIEEIQAILFKLRDRGIGILITDHNVAATLQITGRASGTGAEISADADVRRRYLGEGFRGDEIPPDEEADS